MCPNCILNQAGLAGGVYVAFGVCFFFFVAAIFAMYFGFKNGDFDDIEGSKFDMLDDGDEVLASRQAKQAIASTLARERVLRARARAEQ